MPNPTQIASIVANGMTFASWNDVVVERMYAFKNTLPVHMRLRAIEPEVHGASGIFPVTQRLIVGDQVQCYLAGQLVVDGIVTVRQVSFDAEHHGVEIIVSSLAENVTVSTVSANPGQYLNQTLQQMGSAVFGAVGVGFVVEGASGADKPFPRVSEHVGETRFEFVERLCRMRNCHMVDDGMGTVHATRNPSGTVPIMLAEGENVWKARMVARVDDTADFVAYVGQMPNFGGGWSNPSSYAGTSVPGVTVNRPTKYACEMNADNTDCMLRANHERDILAFEQIDVTITVKDWLLPDGSLWYSHVGDTVGVYSPLLFPGETPTLWICGVRHKQGNGEGGEGTTTEILLTNQPGDTVSAVQGSGDSASLPPAFAVT